MESWVLKGGFIVVNGEVIMFVKFDLVNFVIWWDGDFMCELLDDICIFKWDYEKEKILILMDGSEYDIVFNNGIKVISGLVVDIFGDWCEEVIWWIKDSRLLRLFFIILFI